MRIRDYRHYVFADIYKEYLKAHASGEVFDVYCGNYCAYIDYSQEPLSENQFMRQAGNRSVFQYTECKNFTEYRDAQRQHKGAVLPNGSVLTIFTDYTRDEFEQALSGAYVKAQARKKPQNLEESIYNTNKIEGVDVTLEDTRTILAGGEAVNVKYDDALVILNSRHSYNYRKSLPDFPTDPYVISRLHFELMNGVRNDAGKFRTGNVWIGSASHQFSRYDDVPHLMEKLCEILHDDPVMLASLIHANFIKIHPFGDGNGRIGRLITHPYTDIPHEYRLEYYAALDAFGSYESVYGLYVLLESLNRGS